MKKFNINSMKPIKINDQSKLIKIDPKQFFKHQEKVANALSQALIEGDKEAFQEIIVTHFRRQIHNLN